VRKETLLTRDNRPCDSPVFGDRQNKEEWARWRWLYWKYAHCFRRTQDISLRHPCQLIPCSSYL
jgi:hypothetical protein